MRVLVEAVRGENLTEGEEGGHSSAIRYRLLWSMMLGWGGGCALVFEDNVVAAEGPAVVARVEVVAEWQNPPC